MTGFVYAIGGNIGRVKIGWSADPCKRLVKIKSDCPTACTLIGIVEATKAQEAEAHALLEPWKIQGEWFRHDGPVAAFVAMLRPPRPKPVVSGYQHPLRAFRHQQTPRLRLKTLAQRVGSTHASLSRIEKGKQTISIGLAQKCAAVTGIPIRELRPDLARHFGEAQCP